jgi:hypothetical protein
MKCYLTLIGRDSWKRWLDRVSALIAAHGLHHSDIVRGGSFAFEANSDIEGIEIFVRHFLRWLQEDVRSREGQQPPWSIVATDRHSGADAFEASEQALPPWILTEFHNTVLLEEPAYGQLVRVAPEMSNLFQFHERLGFYVYHWSPPRRERGNREGDSEVMEVTAENFSNDPHGPPQRVKISTDGFSHLVRVAERLCSGIRTDHVRNVGGVNALVLLSAERNGLKRGMQPVGSFDLYNLSALGLHYSPSSESLVNSVINGELSVLEVRAEPTEEEEQEDGISRTR